jgi:uncharacterized protein (DUF1800 family)
MLRRSMKYCSILLAISLSSPLGFAQEMSQKGKKPVAKKSNLKNLTEEQKASHLLDRVTFGPRPGEIERVMKIGWKKYLEEQLNPDRIADKVVEEKLKPLESVHLSNSELAKNYVRPAVVQKALNSRRMESSTSGATGAGATEVAGANQSPEQMEADARYKRREALKALAEMGYKPQQLVAQELQQAKILRAVYSERQLQEVMTDFWLNHFNVYIQKGPVRILATSYERDVIRPRVFGKFEDLLRATAESPAMLFYLDNWLSASPNAKSSARNLRQQMRREQRRVNKKGKIPKSRKRGLNENYAREIMELHTLGVDGGYTQKDVQEVARCFTGWTLRNPRAGGDFFFNPNIHDDGEKVVLGNKIPAGGGIKDGERVIKLLAHHPSTAKFISTKLVRKFVSDNPPRSLVDKMANTFLKTDGDIREVLRAMFNSQEFWAPENYRAKIKTPFEMTVSAVRALGAETNGNPAFHRWMAQMGEGLFMAQPPTGYPDTSEHWVNTGALLERMNFALALSSNRIQGTRVDLAALDQGITTGRPAEIVDRYVKLLLRGEISPQSRATIDKALSEQKAAGGNRPGVDVARIAGLILGSPEFQRQ